jgi:tRNA(Ile)-lysidine synthase
LRQHIEATGLLRSGDRVGVAVSGGADSVALLLLLTELREKLGIVLVVAHFNHQLRGKASDADELFVRKLAGCLGLPFQSDHANVAAQAKRERANLEDTARRARYAFFARLVAEGHATRIAVAHTADDQAETVLAHILRGTGLAGLAGISAVSGHVFRPLLEFRRHELRAYLRARNQRWREDVTNRDTSRMRARIRKKLLPMLEKQFQPAIVEQLSTLASLACEDDHFLNVLAQHFISSRVEIASGTAKIKIAELVHPLEENLFRATSEHTASLQKANASRALSKRVIRQLVAAVKPRAGQLTALHTAEVLRLAERGESGKSLQLPGGVEVRRERDTLVFCASRTAGNKTVAVPPGQYSHVLDLNRGNACVPIPELGCAFRLTVIDWPPQRRETIPAGAFLDRNRLRDPVVLRNGLPGDALHCEANGKARKLKRLLNDKHVSRWEKQGWPVLTSGGILAWARGFPVAAEFVPEERTRTVLVIAEEHL